MLPFEAGLAYEATAFADCLNSDTSRALRHIFLAQRAAVRAVRASPPEDLKRVGVIGGGRIGADLARACLDAGLSVTLLEQDSYAAEKAERSVAQGFDRHVARGRLTSQVRAKRLGRLSCEIGAFSLSGAQFVIDCVDEDLALKRRVLRDAAQSVGEAVPLASASSWLDLEALGASIPVAERFLGLHFLAPSETVRLVELVPTSATSDAVAAAAAALVRRLGKVAVRTGPRPGYIVNRMIGALRRAADMMVEDGAEPAAVDAALTGYGFALGPYQALDREGLDVTWQHRQALAGQRDPGTRYAPLADRMVESGWIGLAAGRGFYRYGEGTKPVPDPQVLDLIAQIRREKGLSPRTFSPTEIVVRSIDALTNEGARTIEDGTARSGSDIDVAMVLGAGFPRWKGGPMLAADLGGLVGLRKRLQGRVSEAPEFWTPAPLIDRLIRDGRRFGDDINAD